MTKEHELEKALSYERFARYEGWAAGDRARALELYTLNAKLSESLYITMQMLEVSLRNRIHTTMSVTHGEDWFKNNTLIKLAHQQEQVAKAISDVNGDGKEATPGRVVAALTFSFWTSMLSPDYETLWQTTLFRIARKPNGKGLRRKDLSGPLRPIRTLRNRIAHHEPIIAWNLPSHHSKALEIILWLSPAAHEWCLAHCRFASVYPVERIELAPSDEINGQ
ncbi:Abi family protein [Devosia honganensis]|uniref:Abi family protein n=1 Tax=Devosia honganensis TaxID=1610527 RepID=A0ABV7X6H7_9HYPH